MGISQSPTFVDLHPATDRFLDDVQSGLARTPKSLSPKYFYDDRGSALFEAICGLPEYYPTRTELALMREHVVAMAASLGSSSLLIEFGSGAGIKTEVLLQAMQPAAYVAVDISSAALRAAADRHAAIFPGIPMIAVCADYMQPLEIPGLSAFSASRRVIYFPGSTIGNLTLDEARGFLRDARRLAGPGGAMLIGVDLKKDPAVLHAAYNDAQGVTAAFNVNLLERINRELGADFEVAKFRHIAFYDAVAGRIEMHLESQCAQSVSVSGRRFAFAAGERLHTENSCKYSVDEFRQLAQSAGFRARQVWSDPQQYFAVHLLET